MPLIVDAYNLLHAPMPQDLPLQDVAGLCRLLAAGPWHNPRRTDVTVVCDGVVRVLGLTESPAAGVDLVYSGSNRTADDVIIAMIKASSAPRQLTIVTGDRAIQRAARARKANVCESDDFARMLDRVYRKVRAENSRPPDSAGGNAAARQGSLSDDQVDQWLAAFGVDDSASDPPENADENWWDSSSKQ